MFLAMHINNQKLGFDIFTVWNIFIEHDLNILMIFVIKEKCIILSYTNSWFVLRGTSGSCLCRCGSSCSSAPPSGGPSVTRWTSSWWWSARQASGASHHAPVCLTLQRMLMCVVFQHDRPVSHDHVGSDAAAVCGGSGHAVLPLHIQVNTAFFWLVSMQSSWVPSKIWSKHWTH